MYNWNTNLSAFDQYSDNFKIWKLSQLINYGLNGEKINKPDLIKYWPQVKTTIDPYRARMIEYLVWGKTYSLPTNLGFWSQPPKTQN